MRNGKKLGRMLRQLGSPVPLEEEKPKEITVGSLVRVKDKQESEYHLGVPEGEIGCVYVVYHKREADFHPLRYCLSSSEFGAMWYVEEDLELIE